MVKFCQVEKAPPQISPGGESVRDDPPAQTAPLHRYIRLPGRAATGSAAVAAAAAAAALLKIFPSLLKLSFPSHPPPFLSAPRERQIFLKVPVQQNR